ncbi:NAD-dependent epimerase/dehydratase family protein [Variovorax sp. 38R]|uniref:NAD-dependent epimerase/dehydratase family protein n=1 Tax=Variovorax sp. 38R TaxID=2774875 RepID=UPI00177FA4EA|nr:NAD(P)-dependent oxidoreductase [Variovorax sp. 38R]QOF79245.1 NAD(P)-dependent oxidoreductase [Variovorax sp. 38R]
MRLTSDKVWDGLRGQAVFMTGGTGFVGKWLLECLLHADRRMELGLALTVLTREPDRFARSSAHLANASAVRLVQGDIVDFEFPAGVFSSVIHAALPVAAPQSGDAELVRLADAGARRVCEFAAARGARRLLHVSSGAVYGTQGSPAVLSEELTWSDEEAVNGYTRAKRRAEAVVMQPWPFEVLVARCFAFIGPCLLPSSGAAAAQFIATAASGEGIVIQGTGQAVRTYQYAGDMARWLLSSLVLGAPGRAYNIGGDVKITIAELAARITRLAGTGVPPRVAGQAAPGLAGPCYVPDLRRTTTELELRNAVDLEEGIRRTLAWQKASSSLSNAPT